APRAHVCSVVTVALVIVLDALEVFFEHFRLEVFVTSPRGPEEPEEFRRLLRGDVVRELAGTELRSALEANGGDADARLGFRPAYRHGGRQQERQEPRASYFGHRPQRSHLPYSAPAMQEKAHAIGTDTEQGVRTPRQEHADRKRELEEQARALSAASR